MSCILQFICPQLVIHIMLERWGGGGCLKILFNWIGRYFQLAHTEVSTYIEVFKRHTHYMFGAIFQVLHQRVLSALAYNFGNTRFCSLFCAYLASMFDGSHGSCQKKNKKGHLCYPISNYLGNH